MELCHSDFFNRISPLQTFEVSPVSVCFVPSTDIAPIGGWPYGTLFGLHPPLDGKPTRKSEDSDWVVGAPNLAGTVPAIHLKAQMRH